MELFECLKNVLISLTNIKKYHLEENGLKYEMEFLLMSRIDIGSDLFADFFQVGCEANKNRVYSFKNLEDSFLNQIIKDIVCLLVDSLYWMQGFLRNYINYYIFNERNKSNDVQVFEVRSGLQFLLDLFNGINQDLDEALEYLRDDCLWKFDAQIGLVKKKDKNLNDQIINVPYGIPSSHTWWF